MIYFVSVTDLGLKNDSPKVAFGRATLHGAGPSLLGVSVSFICLEKQFKSFVFICVRFIVRVVWSHRCDKTFIEGLRPGTACQCQIVLSV